jgi:hypothetical protein
MFQESSGIAFPDWHDDVAAVFRIQCEAESSNTGFQRSVDRYFETRYSDAGFRRHTQNRVESALKWLEANLPEIEDAFPGDTVEGNTDALVSNRLVTALFALFSQCPNDHLRDRFPVSTIAPYLTE